MSDLLIIGAGPAGLSAAIAAAEKGLSVTVIDEFPKAGGRLLGQLHQEPNGEWWNGIQKGEQLSQRARQLGVTIQCEVSVYDISQSKNGWDVYTTKGEYKAEKLLLATGATESPIPVKGWTLPGVMTIGAAQIMGNVHRVKPGNSCIIIGANVLSMAIANELKLCGVNVKEIIIPKADITSNEAGNPEQVLSSLMRLTHLAPTPILRQLGKIGKLVHPKIAIKLFPRKGIRMFDIPLRLKNAALEIVGDRFATGVRTANIKANGEIDHTSEKVVDADFVCIAGGLTPLSELASIIGCSFKYIPELGGHVPVHNEQMQTNIPGLYVAGNITGIESAKVAMAQGRVAGLAIAADIMNDWEQMETSINKAIENVNITRDKALIQFHPGISDARKKFYQKSEVDLTQISKIKKREA
ncbi:NAD(P)/FAD-dependent oxidoreductase [Pseudalkalibacillus salsuginis]|uniref:NAD(P)/FAD-dependent oxidoreductase n=1 Tax=Pseudalkalibacillus salsuginis TaxID=2910972 RepID=UPI001F225E0A|nr:FAD-dependent oxidoreductase [Pseudalkalibacillus salsuginis]MCF6409526.1 NAD(P)/FAD-dependent oxidoreductase [Pseudalkalibacillus salsuginis]